MQVAVGQDHKAAIERFGVFARLLFANQRVFVFCLGFQHHKREGFFIQQQKVNKAFAGGFKVVAQFAHGINLAAREFHVGFERNVGFALCRVKKAPASGFEQLVDFDTGLGFFGHVL